MGRDAERAELAERVEAGTPFVTLLGPPGVGKTRLAGDLAERCAAEGLIWGQSLWFCDLTPCSDGADVVRVIARELRIPPETQSRASDAGEMIGRWLDLPSRCLVVLDNVEHVAGAVADMLPVWSRRAPRAVFVLTSRVPVIDDEAAQSALIELGGLELPDSFDPDGPARPIEQPGSAAEDLFHRLADYYRARLDGPDDARRVAEIVRQLDGNPLAIELAAARLQVLSLGQLSDRLDERFRLLRGQPSQPTPHHLTMWQAIEWSWDLLEPYQRDVLVQCGVFRGGFSLEAAEAVIEMEGGERGPDVLDGVHQLCRHSLLNVVREHPLTGEARFSMAENIRAFARSRLNELGSSAAIEARHREHYLSFGESVTRAVLEGRDHELDRLEADFENLWAAVRGAMELGGTTVEAARDSLRAVFASAQLLYVRGPSDLLEPLLERAMEHAALHPELRASTELAWCTYWHIVAHYGKGRVDAAEQTAHELEAVAERAGEGELRGEALWFQGVASWARGRRREALDLAERALVLLRNQGRAAPWVRALATIGGLRSELGDQPGARAAFERAIELATASGVLRAQADVHHQFGLALSSWGDDAAAYEHFKLGVAYRAGTGDRRGLAVAFFRLASLDHVGGDLAKARTDYERALTDTVRMGDTRLEARIRAFLALIELEVARLERAEAHLAKASEALEASGSRAYGSVIAMGRVLAHAQADRLDDASAALATDLGADDPSPDAWRSELVELGGAAVEGLAALAAGASSQPARLEHVDGPVESGLRSRSMPVRLAARVVRAMLQRARPRPTAWLIARDGSAFRPPDGDVVSLAHRPTLHALVAALGLHHREAPGVGLTRDELFAVGWPDEQLTGRSAASRVYVAISTLRKLGLEPLLTRLGSGYGFDPSTSVTVLDELV